MLQAYQMAVHQETHKENMLEDIFYEVVTATKAKKITV